MFHPGKRGFPLLIAGLTFAKCPASRSRSPSSSYCLIAPPKRAAIQSPAAFLVFLGEPPNPPCCLPASPCPWEFHVQRRLQPSRGSSESKAAGGSRSSLHCHGQHRASWASEAVLRGVEGRINTFFHLRKSPGWITASHPSSSSHQMLHGHVRAALPRWEVLRRG